MDEHAFEVKDISFSGMQLALKSGEHNLNEGEKIHGRLHWSGRELEINGTIKWTTDKRLGVEFSNEISVREEVQDFLNLELIAKSLKPVHQLNIGSELPANLKFWLRADGPVEVFVWQHSDGEFARFQVLIMENLVEWEDGKGLRTARVISKRDIETPLISEDEYVFKMDESLDDDKIDKAAALVNQISREFLSPTSLDFLKLKLNS